MKKAKRREVIRRKTMKYVMARSSSHNAGEPQNSLRRHSSSSASSKERTGATRNSSLEHPSLESKEHVSKVVRLPDTWTRVSNFGDPIHRFVPFKLPLNVKELTGVDEYYKFGWKRLILGLAEKSIELGLVIDLSGDSLPTLQDSKSCIVELEKLNVSTCPLAARSYEEFAQYVNEFLEDEQNSMKYIGVYCLSGVDLSGLFICKYLICNDRWMPAYAIKMFSMARGHEIRHAEYLDHLRTLKPGTHIASSATLGKNQDGSKAVDVKTEIPEEVVKEEPISDIADVRKKGRHNSSESSQDYELPTSPLSSRVSSLSSLKTTVRKHKTVKGLACSAKRDSTPAGTYSSTASESEREVRTSKKKKKRVKKRTKKEKSSSANRSSASSLSRRSPQAYKLKNSNVLPDDLDTISSATDDEDETEHDSSSSDEAKQSVKNKLDSDSTRSSKASSSRKIQDTESNMSKKSKVSSPRSRKESSQTTKSRRGSSLSTAESSQSRSPVAYKGQKTKLPATSHASPSEKRSPRVSPKRERNSSGSSSDRRAPLPTLSDRYRSIDENMKLQQKKLEDVLKKEKAEQEQVRINDEIAKAMRYTDPKHFQRKKSAEKSRKKSSDIDEKSSKRKRDQVQPTREVSSSSSERNSSSVENSRSKRNGEKMRDSKSPSRKRRKSGSHCDPVALSKEAARIKRELRSITDEESDRERKKRKERKAPPKTYSQKWLKDNFSSVSKDSDRNKNRANNSKSRDRDRVQTGNARARSRSPIKARNRLDSSVSRNEKSRRSSPESSSRSRKGPVGKRDLSPPRYQRRRSKSKDKPSQRSTSVGRSRRSRSKDRKRSVSRNRSKRSKSKEKAKRSLSREKPPKSKSIDRSRKSRSRDRNRRSRSRDKNRRSRSRDKQRKSRSRERRGRPNVDNISSYQKDKEEAQKSTKNFMRELVGQIQNNKLDVDHREASKEVPAKQNCGPSLDLDEYKNRILGVMADDNKEEKTEPQSQSNSYQTTINVVGHVSVDYQSHIPVAPPLNPLVVHSFPKYSTFDTPTPVEVKSVHSQESGEALSQDERPEQESKSEPKQAATEGNPEKEPKKDASSNPTPGTNKNPNYRPRYSPETQLITKAIRHFAPKLGGVRPVLDGTFTPIVRPPPLARVRPPLPPTPAVQVPHRPAPMYNAMSMAPRNPAYVSRPPLAPIAAEPRLPFRGPQNYVRGVPVPIRRPMPTQQFVQRPPPLRPPNGPMHYRPESEAYFEQAPYHNGVVGRAPPPIRQRLPPPPDNNLNITML